MWSGRNTSVSIYHLIDVHLPVGIQGSLFLLSCSSVMPLILGKIDNVVRKPRMIAEEFIHVSSASSSQLTYVSSHISMVTCGKTGKYECMWNIYWFLHIGGLCKGWLSFLCLSTHRTHNAGVQSDKISSISTLNVWKFSPILYIFTEYYKK